MEKTPMLNLIRWLESQIKVFSDKNHPDYNQSRSVSFILVKRKIVGNFLRQEKEFISKVIFDGAASFSQEDFEYFIDELIPEKSDDISIKDYYDWVQSEAMVYALDQYKNTGYANKILNINEKVDKLLKKSDESKNQLLLEFGKNKKEYNYDELIKEINERTD